MLTLVGLAPTRDALAEHINSRGLHSLPQLTAADVVVKEYADRLDERIGWPVTSIVVIPGWGPIGFVDVRPGDVT